MHALRELFWLSAVYNFHIKAKYVPGSDNIVADAISKVASPGGLDMLASVLGYSCNPMPLYCFNCKLLLTECMPSPVQLRRHTIQTEISI